MVRAKPEVSDRALEEAAKWFIQLNQEQVETVKQQAFNSWLELTEHQVAWNKIKAVNDTFNAIKKTEQSDIARCALTHLQQPEQRLSRRAALRRFSLVVIAGFTWQLTPNIRQYYYSKQAQFQTAVGATFKTELNDGSQIWLNTNTALDQLYTTKKREIALYHGEVYINTAIDKHRPLFVSTTLASQPITYTALGTEFLIEQDQNTSQLSVYQGKVAIHYKQQQLIVSSGEQVIVTESGFGGVTQAQKNSLAWQQGELRAKDISLKDFCRQLERYHSGIITLSEQASDLRVVGIFPIFDLEASLDMLSQSLPITIHQHIPWWTRIETS